MNKLILQKNKPLTLLIIALLTLFAISVSAPVVDAAKKKGDATSKKKKPSKPAIDPKTDAGKIALAARWAKNVTNKMVKTETPANANPSGLSKGIGLKKRFSYTRPFINMYRFTRFTERARLVPVPAETKQERVDRSYALYSKMRELAKQRAKARVAISKREVNAERKAKVEAAAENYANSMKTAQANYAQSVKSAKVDYSQKRQAIANYRKNKGRQIIAWAKKKNQAINRKLKTATGAKRAALLAAKVKVRAKRFSSHSRNVLRYQIKMAAITSDRTNKINSANSVLNTKVSNAENTLNTKVESAITSASRQADQDNQYISRNVSTEISIAVAWRTRARTAIFNTPVKK